MITLIIMPVVKKTTKREKTAKEVNPTLDPVPARKGGVKKKPKKAKVPEKDEKKTSPDSVAGEVRPPKLAAHEGEPPAASEARSDGRPAGRAAPTETSLVPKGRERYFEAVGRRKTAVARVRLFTKPGDFLVNDKIYTQYFPTLELQKTAEDSLQKMKLLGRFKVTVKVSGGGIHSQAEATRHGLARSLIKFNPDFRKRLKRVGFLRRDPRAKERKKFGLKGARKAPQWHKR